MKGVDTASADTASADTASADTASADTATAPYGPRMKGGANGSAFDVQITASLCIYDVQMCEMG